MKDSPANFHILKGFKKMLWFLGEHAFSVILVFILINTISGALIIYVYIILAQGKDISIDSESFKFKESTYQKVITQQEKNQQHLDAIEQSSSENFQEDGL